MRSSQWAKVMCLAIAVGVAGGASAAEASAAEPAPGQFSAALNAGVVLPAHGALGLTLTYWASESFLFDVSPTVLFASRKGLNLLAGPRLRISRGMVGVNLGLQAGPLLDQNGPALFIVSPQVGVEALLSSGTLVGVGYAGDFTFYPSLTHRFFVSLGHRF